MSSSSSCRRIVRVCLFAGSKAGKDREFYKIAMELGTILATRKINLVYGGGSLGLMEGVATSAFVGGSRVLGVIPKAMNHPEIIGLTMGDELQVWNMQERINNMMLNADAFIILPGGFGTLGEMFQMISWAQVNVHRKPIGILNINGFFDHLFSFLDHAVDQQFISSSARKNLITATAITELLEKLQLYEPELDSEMARIEWNAKQQSKKIKLDLDLSL